MEEMRSTFRRQFSVNGQRFLVQDLMKKDKIDGLKYCLTMKNESKDFWELVYDKILWEAPKFRTLKEAYLWARWNYDFIGTWDSMIS